MKALKTYIFIFIVSLLILNINANAIPKYNKRKIKRQETDPTQNDPAPGNPDTTPQDPVNEDPVKTPDPVVTTAPNPVTTVPPATTAPNPVTTPAAITTAPTDSIPTTSLTPQSTTSGSITTTPSKIDDDNDSKNKKDEGGLSSGVIALIVVGGIFALGVVILVFRALLKVCTRKSTKDYPTSVINYVGNHDSSEQLNPQAPMAQMSQDPLAESGQYYNQSTSNIPAGTAMAVNDGQQYYQQGYDNNGADITNNPYQDYQNGYGNDLRTNSMSANNMVNDYPVLTQDQVIQPVRNFSSLRRPNAANGRNEVPLDGYDNPNMTNGEITETQAPRKVIINRTNNTPIEPGTIHKTQFPFTPNMDDELRLNAGDAVEIIEVYDDGWSYGKNMATNEVGVFPISYITGYNDPSNNF